MCASKTKTETSRSSFEITAFTKGGLIPLARVYREMGYTVVGELVEDKKRGVWIMTVKET